MRSLSRDERETAMDLSARHADPTVRATVRALLEENAVLRTVLANEPSGGRRVAGRIIAALVFCIGLALGALWAKFSEPATELRRGIRDGYRAGMPVAPMTAPAR